MNTWKIIPERHQNLIFKNIKAGIRSRLQATGRLVVVKSTEPLQDGIDEDKLIKHLEKHLQDLEVDILVKANCADVLGQASTDNGYTMVDNIETPEFGDEEAFK